MSITLARAVFQYHSEVAGDLNFNVNDIIEVVRWEDANWIHGSLDGRQGMFPSNFVKILSLPTFNPSTECLLIATKDFVKEDDRDIGVRKDDILVGVRQEDENWWFGRNSDQEGIFPVSHVRWLTGAHAGETSKPRSRSATMSNIPKPVKAQACSDLKGQIDGELSFNAGDFVEIMRVVDDIFCEGTCHGDYGMFPVHVVQILEPDNFAKLQAWCKEMDATSKRASLSSIEKKPKNGEIKSGGYTEKERSITVRSRTSTGGRSFTSETASTPDVVVEAYGKAIATFVGENQDELTFVAGDLVKLICHLDADWTYGEMSDADGVSRRGIFPTKFVDIIVDCPYDEKAQNAPSPSQACFNTKTIEGNTVVADLQKRIVSIEGDIKELQESTLVEPPQNVYSQSPEGGSIQGNLNTLRQDLRFYQDKLSKVTGQQHDEATEDEMRKKRANQRNNVMTELISTEETYLRDLVSVYDIFVESSICKTGVDVGMLFGNLHEVISLSRRFLAEIKQANSVAGSIGEVFLNFREEMVNVYVDYCKNHEDAVKYLVRGDTQLNNYVQDGLARLQEKYNLFTTNLDALIIKPVQRVLKYPLLLNELLRSTEETNKDHEAIGEAVISMTEAVQEINELKRRKDLVQKYLRPQSVDSTAISLAHGMHTLKKKSARLSQRLSSTFGFKSRTIDDEFNREEARFRNCEKCIKVFLRDVQSHCDALKDSLNLHTSLCNDLFDFCADNQSTSDQSVSQTFLDAYIRAMDSFKNVYNIRIESRVLTPLYKLQSLFQGPNKLIKKRYDKLLDYDNMTHSVKKAKDSGQCSRVMLDSLDKAEKIYEAMNDQLKEELPVLNQLSSRLLHECIGNFVQIATQLAENMLIEMRPVLQASPMLTENHLGFKEIMEAFTTQHSALVEKISRFTFVPKGGKGEFANRFTVGSSSDDASVQQLTEHRQSLVCQYPSDCLFIALQTVSASAGDPKGLGLALREGDIVGVIKKAHPMGISGRWYVDNGVCKGFVPSSALTVYSSPPPYSQSSTSEMAAVDKLLMDRDLLSSPTTVWYVNLDEGTFTDAGSNGLTAVSSHADHTFLPPKDTSQPSHYEEIEDFPPRYEDISETPENPVSQPFSPSNQSPVPSGWYRALYPFEARNANEISLVTGQMLQVLQRHDYSGNQEWWLVQADKRQGYVPSYYVQPL